MGCCSSSDTTGPNVEGGDHPETDPERDELIRRQRFAHAILAMQQLTVSELHRYNVTMRPVMDVMVATFTLLGEPKKNLQDWDDIQILLRKLGRKSVMRRVSEFPEKQAQYVTESTASEVQAMIRTHGEANVRLCSPAAGTFYVWVNGVVTDILGNGNTGATPEVPSVQGGTCCLCCIRP